MELPQEYFLFLATDELYILEKNVLLNAVYLKFSLLRLSFSYLLHFFLMYSIISFRDIPGPEFPWMPCFSKIFLSFWGIISPAITTIFFALAYSVKTLPLEKPSSVHRLIRSWPPHQHLHLLLSWQLAREYKKGWNKWLPFPHLLRLYRLQEPVYRVHQDLI